MSFDDAGGEEGGRLGEHSSSSLRPPMRPIPPKITITLEPDSQRQMWKALSEFSTNATTSTRGESSSAEESEEEEFLGEKRRVFDKDTRRVSVGEMLSNRRKEGKGVSRQNVPFRVRLAAQYVKAGVHGRPLDFGHSDFALKLRKTYHSYSWRMLIVGMCLFDTVSLCADVHSESAYTGILLLNCLASTLYVVDALLYLLSYRWPKRNRWSHWRSSTRSRSGMYWAMLRLVLSIGIIVDVIFALTRRQCLERFCFRPTASFRPLIGIFRMRHVRNIFVGAFVEAPRRLAVIGSIIVGQIVWSGIFGFLLLANPDDDTDDRTNTMSDSLGGSIYQFLLLFMCPPELFKVKGPFMSTTKAVPAVMLTVIFVIVGRLFLYRLITASAVGAFKVQLRDKVITLLRRRHDATRYAYRLLKSISPSHNHLRRPKTVPIEQEDSNAPMAQLSEYDKAVSLYNSDMTTTTTTRNDENVSTARRLTTEGVSISVWRHLYVYYKQRHSCCGSLMESSRRSKLKASADAFFRIIVQKRVTSLTSGATDQAQKATATIAALDEGSSRYNVVNVGMKIKEYGQRSVEWKNAMKNQVATLTEFFELCYFLHVNVHHRYRRDGSVCSRLCCHSSNRYVANFIVRMRRWRKRCRAFLRFYLTRWLIDALVVISVLQIVTASNLGNVGKRVNDDDWLFGLGFSLMWVFTLEILMKVWVYGPSALFFGAIDANEQGDDDDHHDDINTFWHWLDLVTVVCSFFSYYVPNGTFELLPHKSQSHNQILRALYACRIFRLGRLVHRVPIEDIQKHLRVTGEIVPCAFRALTVYATVIFFFTNIGHVLFHEHLTRQSSALCDSPLISAATPPLGFDPKDVTTWCASRLQLNFQTFAESLLTMFTVASFGNWKIVMEAAAAAKGSTESRVFFFTYHFCTVTLCLPVLIGYLIQTYLAAYARHSSGKRTVKSTTATIRRDDDDDVETRDDDNVDATQTSSATSRWQSEMEAVSEALYHRSRIRRKKQIDPDVRRNESSSSSDSSSSGDDSNSSDVDANLDFRRGDAVEEDRDKVKSHMRRRRPRLTWEPRYGEGQLVLFGDLVSNMKSENGVDRSLLSSKDGHLQNALQRTVSELVSSQKELTALRARLAKTQRQLEEQEKDFRRRSHRRSRRRRRHINRRSSIDAKEGNLGNGRSEDMATPLLKRFL